MTPFQLPSNLPLNLTTGAIAMGALSYVLNLFRGVFAELWWRIKSQFLVSVEVRNEDDIFFAVLQWLHEHEKSTRFRMLHAQMNYLSGNSNASHYDLTIPRDAKIMFSLAPGSHFLFDHGRFLWIGRQRHETQMAREWKESISIQMLARDPKHLRAFIERVVNAARSVEDKSIAIMGPYFDNWQRLQSRTQRSMESVILPNDEAANLQRDCEWFLKDKAWYESLGIPYHRGYLFHGVPGAGKSSLVFALASALNKNVYYLSLGISDLTDQKLLNVLSKVPEGQMVLLEDIDAVFVGRERSDKDKSVIATLTFSGLLNAIDGVAAKEGIMIFLTTNHREKLDPALIRPGRVDVQIEFKNANEDQAYRLYRRFFPNDMEEEARRFAEWGGDGTHSMSELQQKLIEQLDSSRLPERIGDTELTDADALKQKPPVVEEDDDELCYGVAGPD